MTQEIIDPDSDVGRDWPARAPTELSARQLSFINHYMQHNIASKAALAAGYAPSAASNASTTLLRNPLVVREIARRRRAAEIALGVSRDRVIAELAAIAFAKTSDAVRWGMQKVKVQNDNILSTGDPVAVELARLTGQLPPDDVEIRPFVGLVDSDELDEGTLAAIQSISLDAKGGFKLKMHDKPKALEALGKYLGIFTDEPAQNTTVNVYIDKSELDV